MDLSAVSCHHFHERCLFRKFSQACAFFNTWCYNWIVSMQSGSLLFPWNHKGIPKKNISRQISSKNMQLKCRRNHFTISYVHTTNSHLTTVYLHNQMCCKICELITIEAYKITKITYWQGTINMEWRTCSTRNT